MEENNLTYDCDGNIVPKNTENEKTEKVAQSPENDQIDTLAENPCKKTRKRRKLYKTSGIDVVISFQGSIFINEFPL